MSEHHLQMAFFKMVRLSGHPAAALTYAVVNGAVGGQGRRVSFFIQEGLLPGVHDVTVLWSSHSYNFATIEFKNGKNKPSAKQIAFGEAVEAAGGRAVYFWDSKKAFVWWCWYVRLTTGPEPHTKSY